MDAENSSERDDDETQAGASVDSGPTGRGQAIQINENTIDDPQPPEPVPGDEELHSRRDFPKRDQAIQINENTIDDPK